MSEALAPRWMLFPVRRPTACRATMIQTGAIVRKRASTTTSIPRSSWVSAIAIPISNVRIWCWRRRQHQIRTFEIGIAIAETQLDLGIDVVVDARLRTIAPVWIIVALHAVGRRTGKSIQRGARASDIEAEMRRH